FENGRTEFPEDRRIRQKGGTCGRHSSQQDLPRRIQLNILLRPDYQVLSSTWRSGRSLPCALESRGATFVHDAGAEHPLSKCTITKLRSGSQTTSATMAGSHDASHTHTGSLSLMLNAPAALIVSSASKDDPTGKMVEAGFHSLNTPASR